MYFNYSYKLKPYFNIFQVSIIINEIVLGLTKTSKISNFGININLIRNLKKIVRKCQAATKSKC